jgi:cytochrome c553
MKKIILFAATLCVSSLLAQTTMCYKQDVSNPSTSETVALDGGKCAGVKSVQDMLKDGWEVNDIKISSGQTGMNYTFIFKKGQVSLDNSDTNMTQEELIQKVMARMTAQQKQKAKEDKIKKQLMAQQRIKEFYIKRCESCHGQKGELNANGTSRPLNSLSVHEMNKAILNYSLGKYDRGLAVVMFPYTNFATEEKLKDIYIYLQSFKDKKQK